MATIGDLLVKLGISQDKASFKKAESSVKKFGNDARKMLAKIGIALSAAKLISILKNTENIKNEIAEVKKNWTQVFTELDNSLGVTKTIAAWIRKGSNYLLSLFRKIEPFLKNAVKMLGGTENALKSILTILIAIKASKALSTAFGFKSSTIGIIVAVLYSLYLIIEDIVFFVQGKGSFLGHLCKKYGVDVDKLRAKLKSIITKAKSFIPKAFTFIKDTLGKVFQKISTAAEKAFVIIKNFWENHGQKIAKNLKDAWDKLTEAFQKLKEKLQPVFDKIGEIVGKFKEGEDAIDIWDLIGLALEKVSDFILLVADGIDKFVSYLPTTDEMRQTFENIRDSISDAKDKVMEFLSAIAPFAAVIGGVAAAFLLWNTAMKAGQAIGFLILKMMVLMHKASQISLKDKALELALKAKEAIINAKDLIMKGLLAAKQAILNAVMSANPIGLIILAIVALIAIIIVLVKNWDKIKEKAKEIASKVKEKFNEIKETIKNKLEEAKAHVKQKLDNVKEKFTNAFNKIKAFLKEWGVVILAFLANPLAGIIALIVKYRDQIAQKIAELKEKIKTIISNIKEAVGAKVSEIITTIKTKWEEIKTWFTGLPAKALQWGKDFIQGFINGISEKWKALKDKIGGITNLFSRNLEHSTPDEGPMKDDDKWMPDFMSNMIGGIDKKLPELKDRIKGIASAFNLKDGLNLVMSKTQSLVAGASATNVINMNNNWTNNFNGDQGKAFASAVTAQEDQVGATLGRRLANTR